MAIILDASDFYLDTYTGDLEVRLFKALAARLPGFQFLYPAKPGFSGPAASNLQAVPFPADRGFFQTLALQKWLKAQNATHFISFNRTVKANSDLRRLFIIKDAAAWANEKAIKNADALGIVSSGLFNQFVKKYPEYRSKAVLLEALMAASQATEATYDVKEKLTSGKEYFAIADFGLSREKLTTVLKGFSAFKKRQQSNWKLLVVLREREGLSREAAAQLVSNYKYREDVVLTDNQFFAEKIARAYTVITLTSEEVFPSIAVEALSSRTPVAAIKTETIENLLGAAAVYLQKADSEAIGDMLMTMYKGETFRKNLIKKMDAITYPQNLDETAAMLLNRQ
ncbi:glycosyltransferase [Niabella insulamsoli]|uniref:glycosyltransferase n=1 Tax=Niabella insulamsoli TaxID=3144874 RepID=UPI0031FD4B2A